MQKYLGFNMVNMADSHVEPTLMWGGCNNYHFHPKVGTWFPQRFKKITVGLRAPCCHYSGVFEVK